MGGGERLVTGIGRQNEKKIVAFYFKKIKESKLKSNFQY